MIAVVSVLAAMGWLLDYAAVPMAFEQVGCAQAALDMVRRHLIA